jgi:hypothetical protein
VGRLAERFEKAVELAAGSAGGFGGDGLLSGVEAGGEEGELFGGLREAFGADGAGAAGVEPFDEVEGAGDLGLGGPGVELLEGELVVGEDGEEGVAAVEEAAEEVVVGVFGLAAARGDGDGVFEGGRERRWHLESPGQMAKSQIANSKFGVAVWLVV